MKLSCSSWSYHRSFDDKQFTLLAWIEFCALTLGLDGVEIEDKHFQNTNPQTFKTIKTAIADQGMALANICTFNDFGHEDKKQNEHELDRVKRWVDHSLELASPSLRVFAGWPPGDRQTAWGRMLEYLNQSAEYAERQGITLVLENHNHGGFIQTSEDTLRAINAIDSPCLRPLLDTGNYLDGLTSIEQVVHLTPHVHAKLLQLDDEGKEVDIDHAAIINLLHEANYRGFISAEYEGDEDERTAVLRGIQYLRQLLSQSNA